MNSENMGLTQKALGKLLGLSPAAITKLRRQGMPVDSVEAARAWRLMHVRPYMYMNSNPVHNCHAELAALEALWPVARSAISAGRFDLIGPALRAAMHAVPKPARHLALVDCEVMEVLCAEFIAAAVAAVPLAPEDNRGLTDDEAGAMGRVWYAVATGERFPLSWLEPGTPAGYDEEADQ